MNVIYEKLYAVTYFVIIIVIIASITSAGYYTIVMMISSIRSRFVADLMVVGPFKNKLL